MAGRPRNFSEPELLKEAAKLFQEHGFDGVSVPQLVDQLSISRQSLYSIYGDKRGLFLKVLEDYASRELEPVVDQLESGDDPLGAIDLIVDSWLKKAESGVACMVTRNMGEELGADVRRAFAKHLNRMSRAIHQGLHRARKLGHLRKRADVEALAGSIIMIGQGVSAVCTSWDSATHIRNAVRATRAMIDTERTAKGRRTSALAS